MTLLIVEDNYITRSLLRRMVAGLADVIYECDDGAEALATYATHQPAWVLMDIRMKRMDGLQATRQIKAAFPTAKVIIVTSYDDADSREAAREAGACEYVLKENLLELVRILTGGSS
jgi:CheY-like chemotaxis protein